MAKYLSNIDLNQNELQNAVLQNLATAPASPKKGQKYFNTTDNKEYYYNGTEWVAVSKDTDTWRAVKVNGTEKFSANSNSPIDFVNGSHTTATYTATGKVHFDHNAVGTGTAVSPTAGSAVAWGGDVITGVSIDSFGHVSGVTKGAIPANPEHNQTVVGSNGQAFGADDTIKFVGGTNVSTAANTTAKTITISVDQTAKQDKVITGAASLAVVTSAGGTISTRDLSTADSGTGYVSSVTQDAQGKITVTKTALPADNNQTVVTSSGAAFGSNAAVKFVSGSNIKVTGSTTNTTVTVALANSPALTGTPTAPTAAEGTSTTQIATTAFVRNEIKDLSGAMHFRGVADQTTEPSTGKYYRIMLDSDGNPVTTGGTNYYTTGTGTETGSGREVPPKAGDVLIHGIKEYVHNGSEWKQLGDETAVVTSLTSHVSTGSHLTITDNSDAKGAVTIQVGVETDYSIPSNAQQASWNARVVNSTAKSVTDGTHTISNIVSDANYKHITVTESSVSDGTTTFSKYVHPTHTAFTPAAIAKITVDSLGHVGSATAATGSDITALLGYTPAKKYTADNGALTASSGVCTWTVTHNIGTKLVTAQVYEKSSGDMVVPDITLTDSNSLNVKILSSSNISANTYSIVVIG